MTPVTFVTRPCLVHCLDPDEDDISFKKGAGRESEFGKRRGDSIIYQFLEDPMLNVYEFERFALNSLVFGLEI